LRDPNGLITLKAGAANDLIRVARMADGRYRVNVNDHSFAFSQDEMKKLTIHAGDGDNAIMVDRSVDVPISVKAGQGRDRVFNSGRGTMIDTGAGDDRIVNRGEGAKIHGGAGSDYIDHQGRGATLSGGEEDDVISARGTGNLVQGGNGHDELSAEGTNNYVRGGAGNDVGWVSGSQNRLEGNAGEDALFATGAYNQVQRDCGCNGSWDHVGILGPNFVNGQLTQGRDVNAFLGEVLQTMLMRNVGPGAFAPRDAPGQEAQPVQGLVDGTGAAPTAFDALNVHRDLRAWTEDCGARGCCKWEAAIA
jgi:Ca2+-binding RTX toxin-like protein